MQYLGCVSGLIIWVVWHPGLIHVAIKCLVPGWKAFDDRKFVHFYMSPLPKLLKSESANEGSPISHDLKYWVQEMQQLATRYGRPYAACLMRKLGA